MATAPQHFGDPLLRRTLLVSLLFHLSAITLFSVVIYFPKEARHYTQLAFVKEATEIQVASNPIAEKMTRPRPELPAVSLPQLEFNLSGQLEVPDRLRLSGKSLFEDAPGTTQDSWAKFGEGIQQFRQSLREIAGVPQLRTGNESAPIQESAIDLGRGVEVSLDWGRATPREVLFSMPAIVQAKPPAGDVEFLITIDTAGAVSSAVPMSADPTPYEKECVELLRGCRFAPERAGLTTTLTVKVRPAAGSDAP